MQAAERAINFYTPHKVYTGIVDLKEENIRTIDLLNSANIYWRDPAEKSFTDAILLHRASVELAGGQRIGKFSKLQMRLGDIIFFTDYLDEVGNATDRIRENTLAQKSREKNSTAKILTKIQGDSFYIVTGTFAGLFKSKSRHRYMPISNANVTMILRSGEKWITKTVIKNQFVGMSTGHIESCSFSQA